MEKFVQGKMPIPLRSYSQSSTRFFFFFLEQPELGYSILFSLSFHVKSVTGGRVGGNVRIHFMYYGFLVAIFNESNASLRNFF